MIESITDQTGPEFRQAQRLGTFCVRPLTHYRYRVENTSFLTSCDDWLIGLTPGDFVHVDYGAFPGHTVWDVDPQWALHDTLKGIPGNRPEAIPVAFTGPLGLAAQQNLVLGDAYAKAMQADWDGLVYELEFAKTLVTVGRLITLMPRMIHWVKCHRHRLTDRGSFIRGSRYLANQWLEYRYGFMQLIYDYRDVMKLMTRHSGNYRIVTAARTFNGSDAWTRVDESNPISNRIRTMSCSRQDTIRAGLVLRIRPMYDITRRAGLAQPLSTLWEVTPFSWLIDWAFDVSTALSALEGRFLLQPEASWVTSKCSVRTERTFSMTPKHRSGSTYSDWYNVTGGSAAGFYEYEKYDRVANPHYMPPPLPEFKLRLNWKRMADLASLLRVFKRDAWNRR